MDYSSLMNSLMQPTMAAPAMPAYVPDTNPMGDTTGQAVTEPSKNLLQQAQDMYPKLKGLDYGYIESQPTSKDDFRKLEHWKPGDPGDEKFKRPEGVPTDKHVIQVLDKNVKPTDVAGDIVSHNLVSDKENHPELYKLNKQFEETLKTSAAKSSLREFYKEDHERGDNRPYKQWLEQTGKPTYLRGYLFNQFPESEIDKHYSKQQKQILDKMDNYLKSDE
jgi:hypothetical protein